jgi:hypothetical protein
MSNEPKLFFQGIKKKFPVLRNWMLYSKCWMFLLELKSPGSGSKFGFKTLVIPPKVLKIAMLNKKVITVHPFIFCTKQYYTSVSIGLI